MKKNQTYNLIDVEIETLKRATTEQNLTLDVDKRTYTGEELINFGLAREGYNKEEINDLGITPSVVSSHDEIEQLAKESLILDTPFGSGIEKWQLPIDMMPIRVAKTVFPKGSKVESHVHPQSTEEDPGGGLRMVAKGSITYNNKKHLPGDWFFIPNGVPYDFTTDDQEETVAFYTYRFFGAIEGNRFSHPH